MLRRGLMPNAGILGNKGFGAHWRWVDWHILTKFPGHVAGCAAQMCME